MRGADRQTGKMFSYASPESLVPKDHPLRVIRPLVNAALDQLSGKFEAMYSPFGREFIAPEKLLRALLLISDLHASERLSRSALLPRSRGRWHSGGANAP